MEKKKVAKKVLKIIGIILLIIFVIFIINTIRKLAIIKSIQRTASQYTASTNYHVKSVASGMNEDTTTTIDSYYKDGKRLTVLAMSRDGEVTHKLSIYDDGIKKDIFTETAQQKVVEIETENAMDLIMPIYDYFGGTETSNMMLMCMTVASNVEDIEYNGKKCYRVANCPSFSILKNADSDIDEVYIDKETGLVIRTHFGNSISEREYEFGNIQDEVFIEPDLKEYEVLKK